MEEIAPDWLNDYPEDKFTVFKTCFLSTQKNSHNLDISAEVLKRDAKTILGNFLVAKLQYGDASTHLPAEIIYGYFPKEQDVEFEETEEGNVKAWAYCVVSKQYGQEFNEIFDLQNLRNTSVEMKVKVVDDADEGEVESFDIYGLTCLGLSIKGSCPDAMMTMIRFSQEDADAYFSKIHEHNLTPLQKFAKERKDNMAENKSYKVDKSKEAMSEKAWGEVDKTDLRNKIMDAKNKNSLVKSVYMLVEEGWEDAPSERLKYPVMCFEGDKLVYNRYGLASALAYARQENETAVINKIERIYKKLDINKDSQGKEEDVKMNEIEFAAVDIGDLWGRLWHEIDETRHWEYGIIGIYEEDNKKFAILRDRDMKMYRLDFSLTEDGMTVAEEVVEVKQEFIETDNMKKFAEPENVADYRLPEDDDKSDADDDDKDEQEEDMAEKLAKLEKDIEERDNIIMEKDKELEELRQFKAGVEEKEKAKFVEGIMAEVKEFLDDEAFKSYREEGMLCKMSEIDGWANKVKAASFEASKNKKSKKENTGIWGFAAPISNSNKKSDSVWDRI